MLINKQRFEPNLTPSCEFITKQILTSINLFIGTPALTFNQPPRQHPNNYDNQKYFRFYYHLEESFNQNNLSQTLNKDYTTHTNTRNA